MGAIAGILPRRQGMSRDDLRTTLARMRDAMAERAPVLGGMAIAYDGSIALAHRGGTGPGAEAVMQPLTNETGALWLVADGEPANAAVLRLELIGAGHRFQSTCGSEVILHLYEQYGLGAIERLTGSFAFALWDREAHELILGRDRFGEKPLYVLDRPDELRFASEVRALADGRALSPAAVGAFLTLGYLPEPLTIDGDVRAVPPGVLLRVRGARVRGESFWADALVGPSGEPETDRVRLAALVREAVQDAIEGEDDVGIVLDGDLPSAALLALVRPMLGRGLRTHAFTWTIGPESGGRARFRRTSVAPPIEIARWFQSEHHDHEIGAADLGAAFETAAAGDQPSYGAALAHVRAARMRARGERVWVADLAAPELAGRQRDDIVRWLWRAGRNGSMAALTRAGSRAAQRLRPFGRAATIAGYLDGTDSIAAAYLAAHGLFAPSVLAQVLRPDALAEARRGFDVLAYLETRALRPPGPRCVIPPPSARAAVARAVAAVELGGPLMSGALRDAEAAAVAHGLALRTPLLDHRLFEWIAAEASGAGVLAHVLGRALPSSVAKRVGGNPAPIGTWMRGELRGLMERHLLADDPEGLFVQHGTETLWRAFLGGQMDWRPLWSLAVLRAWIGARRLPAADRTPERERIRRRDAA